MVEYLKRARAALSGMLAALDAFDTARTHLVRSGALADKPGEQLDGTSARLHTAAGRLEHSLEQIESTGLDIVDLQVRMEGEGAALAAALSALGDQLERTGPLDWAHTLHDLDEAAERLAAAIFPNSIEGVREINRTLWEFRPIWNEYGRALAREVTRTGGRRLTSDQVAKVEETAAGVRAAFDAVNSLLNELVMAGPGSAGEVRRLIAEARTALRAAVRGAKSKGAEAYKPFHGVLGRAERLARKIDEQFAELRVPVFPPPDALAELRPLVAPVLYQDLAGVQRFALLNIGARLRSIPTGAAGGEHLLAPRFAVRIFNVFPDRIYFAATADFIRVVEGLVRAGVFEPAPASLHRFNTGSFKQRQSGRGNLQLSYTFGSPELPDDPSSGRGDAGIDLYRSPVRHLFGEVLINHLTGSKTDQFKVFDILASNQVPPIGAFDVVSV